MTPADLFQEAIAALNGHRLRATLSALGIIVGIATVIAALAIGEGARRAAYDDIGRLGIDNVFVRAVARPVEKGRPAAAPALTVRDLSDLTAQVPQVIGSAAIRSVRAEAVAAGRHDQAHLIGATPGWRAIGRPVLTAGRWISPVDVSARHRVAIVGDDLARVLFPDESPVGRRVFVAGTWFDIVGVSSPRAKAKPSSAIQAIDIGRAVFVPITAMDASLGAGDRIDVVEEIALQAESAAVVEAVAQRARRILQRRHDAASFEIVVPRELLNARLRAQRTFDGVLIGIGSLALLISGVGIMNIMLASVIERTQEIGVRRAFGARRRDVVVQFALEAGALCLIGGGLGVPTGAVLAAIVAWSVGWPIAISPAAVALALALAAGTGLAFSVYPARQAAGIDPAEALRAP
jgi:putative ABC transport system permease protein